MPGPDRRRRDTRDRILAASLALFAEKGFAPTTVAEIEGAVGLRPGSGALYRHFSSKDELLLEAVRAYHRRVTDLRTDLAAARATRPAPDVAAELRRIVAALADFLAGERPMVRLGLDAHGLPDAARHVIGDAWDEGYGILEDAFTAHGVTPDRARLLALGAVGSLNHYTAHLATWRQLPAGVDPAAYLDAWIGQWSALALP